jgi:Zn-dependent M28 family amino/carboxypeptidase
MPGWQIDILLTSAEEAGMIGARAFYETHKAELGSNVYVLNFDDVVAGHLRLFTRTGILSSIRYQNPLVEAAKAVASSDPRFSTVQPAEWTTGDFDTACFARGGVTCLSIGSLDESGGMPHLHRPEDTLENVDTSQVEQAINFAEATIRRLAGLELR